MMHISLLLLMSRPYIVLKVFHLLNVRLTESFHCDFMPVLSYNTQTTGLMDLLYCGSSLAMVGKFILEVSLESSRVSL